MSQDIDYRRVRQYVEANVNKRKHVTQYVFLFVSLGMFALFNFFAWFVFQLGTMGEQAVGAGAMLTTGWVVSILYQFINIMMNSKAAERQIRESLTLRGIQQEMARLGIAEMSELGDMVEKPKRREPVRLSDDGELIDANDAELDQPARRSSSNER